MNEKIKKLIEQSYDQVPHERDWDAMSSVFNKEKFANLLLKEVLKETQKVWYQLNDTPPAEGETLRDVGIHIGQKAGIMKVAQHLRKHFDVT